MQFSKHKIIKNTDQACMYIEALAISEMKLTYLVNVALKLSRCVFKIKKKINKIV